MAQEDTCRNDIFFSPRRLRGVGSPVPSESNLLSPRAEYRNIQRSPRSLGVVVPPWDKTQSWEINSGYSRKAGKFFTEQTQLGLESAKRRIKSWSPQPRGVGSQRGADARSIRERSIGSSLLPGDDRSSEIIGYTSTDVDRCRSDIFLSPRKLRGASPPPDQGDILSPQTPSSPNTNIFGSSGGRRLLHEASPPASSRDLISLRADEQDGDAVRTATFDSCRPLRGGKYREFGDESRRTKEAFGFIEKAAIEALARPIAEASHVERMTSLPADLGRLPGNGTAGNGSTTAMPLTPTLQIEEAPRVEHMESSAAAFESQQCRSPSSASGPSTNGVAPISAVPWGSQKSRDPNRNIFEDASSGTPRAAGVNPKRERLTESDSATSRAAGIVNLKIDINRKAVSPANTPVGSPTKQKRDDLRAIGSSANQPSDDWRLVSHGIRQQGGSSILEEHDERAVTLERDLENSFARLREERLAEIDKRDTWRNSPKFSRELLDLRARERALAKQNKYQEAQRLRNHADQLESKERNRHNQHLVKAARDVEAKLQREIRHARLALQKQLSEELWAQTLTGALPMPAGKL